MASQRILDALDGVGGGVAWTLTTVWPFEHALTRAELYERRDRSGLSRPQFYARYLAPVLKGAHLEVGESGAAARRIEGDVTRRADETQAHAPHAPQRSTRQGRASGDRDEYWRALDALAATSEIVIDRPRGSAHPRYPDFIYPHDYGYLAGTRAGDGDGIDVWVGSLAGRVVTGVVVTVDLHKRDAETKILLGCSPEEMRAIRAIHQDGDQSALLIER